MFAHLFLALAATGSLSTPKELAEELHRIAGSDARACGSVTLKDDPKVSMSCAEDALKAGRPFWVAVQSQGVDSLLWSGAARAIDGATWLVRYDSDTSGGGSTTGPKPSTESFLCKDLVISAAKRAVISCPSQPWR